MSKPLKSFGTHLKVCMETPIISAEYTKSRRRWHIYLKVESLLWNIWATIELITLRPPTVQQAEHIARIDQDQIFGLFMTPDHSYHDLLKHVLRLKPLPSFNEVCKMLQTEEASRRLMGRNDGFAAKFLTENTEMIANIASRSNEKKVWRCEYCKKLGHSKSKCWKLHPHFRNKGGTEEDRNIKGLAQTASMDSNDTFVRKSDIEALLKAHGLSKGGGNPKTFTSFLDKRSLIIDSGASDHMVNDPSLVKRIKPTSGSVKIANGQNIAIKGTGKLNIFDKDSNALVLPEFASNLLSVKKTTEDLNCTVSFTPNSVTFQDIDSGKENGSGRVSNGLYYLDIAVEQNKSANISNSSSTSFLASSKLWHNRLGHPHMKGLNLLLRSLSYDHEKCESCVSGKQCRTTFKSSDSIYENCFDLIHSDVWTAPCLSRIRCRHFVTFIDHKSKYTRINLLVSRADVFDAFVSFLAYISNQYNAKVKTLRTDNGGEYVSKRFQDFLTKLGIVHRTSCPYTPQQNGVAERKNRHLMEVARTLLTHKNMPKRFLGDAVTTACYLINKIPTKALGDRSPHEVLTNSPPKIDYLKIFGCVCFVLVPEGQRNKLDARSIKSIFIGYSSTQKGYKCFHPSSSRVIISRDVIFHEDKSFYQDDQWKNPEVSFPIIPPIPSAIFGSFPTGTTEDQRVKEKDQVLSEGKTSKGIEEMERNQNGNDQEPDGINATNEIPLEEIDSVEEEQSENFDHVDQLEIEPEATHNQNTTIAPQPTLRRGNRIRCPPSEWKNRRVYYNNNAVAHPIGNYCANLHLPRAHQAFLSAIDKNREPRNYDEAKEDVKWRKAMDEELDALKRHGTWELTDLPKGEKAVGCKWIYKIKYNSDGSIERYKARLVARGFAQFLSKIIPKLLLLSLR